MLEIIDCYILGPFRQAPARGWIFLVVWTLFVFLFDYWTYFRKNRNVSLSILLLYLGFVFWITIMAREKVDAVLFEPLPLWSWKEAFIEVNQRRTPLVLCQILLNLLLFVPVGFIMYWYKKKKIWISVLWCMVGSFFIELLQLLLHIGLFEWDDILHNTLGYILGLWLGSVLKKVMRRGCI